MRLCSWRLALSPVHLPFFEGAGEAGAAVDAGAAVAVGAAAGAVGTGVGVAVGSGFSGAPDCKTELSPVIAGKDRDKASNMNPAAAPIVIFDKIVCVPRGPNAVLETELENNAPASALPGCNRTVIIKITQARINSP